MREEGGLGKKVGEEGGEKTGGRWSGGYGGTFGNASRERKLSGCRLERPAKRETKNEKKKGKSERDHLNGENQEGGKKAEGDEGATLQGKDRAIGGIHWKKIPNGREELSRLKRMHWGEKKKKKKIKLGGRRVQWGLKFRRAGTEIVKEGTMVRREVNSCWTGTSRPPKVRKGVSKQTTSKPVRKKIVVGHMSSGGREVRKNTEGRGTQRRLKKGRGRENLREGRKARASAEF